MNFLKVPSRARVREVWMMPLTLLLLVLFEDDTKLNPSAEGDGEYRTSCLSSADRWRWAHPEASEQARERKEQSSQGPRRPAGREGWSLRPQT